MAVDANAPIETGAARPGGLQAGNQTPAQRIVATLDGGGSEARRTRAALLGAARLTGHDTRDLRNPDWLNALPPEIRTKVENARAESMNEINRTFSEMIAEQARLDKQAAKRRAILHGVQKAQGRNVRQARVALGQVATAPLVLRPPSGRRIG